MWSVGVSYCVFCMRITCCQSCFTVIPFTIISMLNTEHNPRLIMLENKQKDTVTLKISNILPKMLGFKTHNSCSISFFILMIPHCKCQVIVDKIPLIFTLVIQGKYKKSKSNLPFEKEVLLNKIDLYLLQHIVL